MLKNRKITYLLLVLVAIIWGMIFYRIYSNFGGNKMVEKKLPHSVGIVKHDQHDTIETLSLNYPDPFLKGEERSSDPSSLEFKDPLPSPVSNWPQIEYRGLLTSNNNNESTGLLRIQNTDLLVKQGKVYAAIRIKTLSRDSIFLEYQHESRWISILKH
jgi:hypothetical protein